MKWLLQAHWMRKVVSGVVHVCRTVNHAGKCMDAALARYLKRAFAVPAPKKRPMLLLEPLEGLIMPAAFGFAQSVNFVRESAGHVDVYVQRLDPAIDSASIDFETVVGTAVETYENNGSTDGDFDAASDTLEFEEGQTSAIITINVQGYGAPTGFKYFTINLVADEETVATTTVTIIENDATNGPLVADSSHFTLSNATLDGGGEEDDPGLLADTYNPLNNSLVTITAVNDGQSGTNVEGEINPHAETTLPSGADITVYANGDFTYVPVPGFNGIDSFAITFGNGTDSSTAVVYVNVESNPAIAISKVYTTVENEGFYANDWEGQPSLLAGVVDPDGNDFSITNVKVNGDNYSVPGAEWEIEDFGTIYVYTYGNFYFTPETDFTGMVSFEFTIDNGEMTTTAAAFIIVSAPLPTEGDLIAWDASYVAVENNTLEAGDGHDQPGLLENAFDPEEDSLEITQITVDETDYDPGDPITMPSGATLTVYSDGSFTYEPAEDSDENDSFTVTVSDGSETVLLPVEIDVVKVAPVAVDQFYEVADGSAIQGTPSDPDQPGLLDRILDPDGRTLEIETFWVELGPNSGSTLCDPGDMVVTPLGGTLTVYSDGSFEYTSNFGHTGIETFTINYVADGELYSCIVHIEVYDPVDPEASAEIKEQQVANIQQELQTANSAYVFYNTILTNYYRQGFMAVVMDGLHQIASAVRTAANCNLADLSDRLDDIQSAGNSALNELDIAVGTVRGLSEQVGSWADIAEKTALRLPQSQAAINQLKDQLRSVYLRLSNYEAAMQTQYQRFIDTLRAATRRLRGRVTDYNTAYSANLSFTLSAPIVGFKINKYEIGGFRSEWYLYYIMV